MHCYYILQSRPHCHIEPNFQIPFRNGWTRQWSQFYIYFLNTGRWQKMWIPISLCTLVGFLFKLQLLKKGNKEIVYSCLVLGDDKLVNFQMRLLIMKHSDPRSRPPSASAATLSSRCRESRSELGDAAINFIQTRPPCHHSATGPFHVL